MNHSRYLVSHWEQESPEEESHGHQITEAEREIQAALYQEADRTVKRMTRANKQVYMEDLQVTQKRALQGDNKDRCTRSPSGKYNMATDMLIVDKQGRLLTTEAEQEARWAEHSPKFGTDHHQQLKQKYRILTLT